MSGDLKLTLSSYGQTLTSLAVLLHDGLAGNRRILVVEEESRLCGNLSVANGHLIGLHVALVNTSDVSCDGRQIDNLGNHVDSDLLRLGSTRLRPSNELTRSADIVLVHASQRSVVGLDLSTVECHVQHLIVAGLERNRISTGCAIDTCQSHSRSIGIVLSGLNLNQDIVEDVHRTDLTAQQVQTCGAHVLHILGNIVYTIANRRSELVSDSILHGASDNVDIQRNGVIAVEVDGSDVGRVTVNSIGVTLLSLVSQLGQVEQPPAVRLSSASLDLISMTAIVLVSPTVG